ncbi:Trafficking protein particle complex subunit 33 [Steccherinum ochraceum]|uniref:Trafficking protein particle complex subunit 33 n=1 Tax=Steccherinum ochraceum TaxID=92696 RepID=A0A4R0RIZ9_9APHY|nr:Trafficking protein particle complex subunit 33 [Steccherinum ochraceum]
MATPGSTTLSTAISALADPPLRMMDTPALDYFLIEVVNTLRDSAAVATARTKKLEQEMIDAGLLPPLNPPTGTATNKRDSTMRDSLGSSMSKGDSSQSKSGVEEDDEALRQRLETIGMHVGANIAERLCHDRPLFSDTLDAIKFICKDLWSTCWDKQVDNLRTNHRGVYVLQDNAFKPVTRLSSWEGRADAIKRAKLYVAMPGGIIRGALSRLGFQAAVVPEITQLPQCTFQVKLPKGS